MPVDVESMADVVAAAIDAAVAPLVMRIALLEQHKAAVILGRDGRDGFQGPTGEPGRDGIDGKDGRCGESAYESAVRRGFAGDEAMWLESLVAKSSQVADPVAIDALVSNAVTAAVAPLISAEIEKRVALIPRPKDGSDGIDGKDGKDADDSRVKAIELKLIDFDTRLIETVSAQAGELERAIAALPTPKDGTSVTVEDVAPLIISEVTKHVSALPPAKDGQDGVGLVGAVIDRENHLILTLSNGATKDVGIVVGEVNQADVERTVNAVLDTWPKPKDGVDGAPGRDGTLEGLKFVQVDSRTIEARLKGTGELIEGGVFQFPVPVMRGVFDANATYEPADMVSRGGSVWMCKIAGTGIAPDENTAMGKTMWTLCVKRGRDTKGDPGPPGPQGPRGEKGERGPQQW